MSSDREVNPGPGGLDVERLSAVVSRLREVRRRCAGQGTSPGRKRTSALEVLDAVIADLESRSDPAGGSSTAEDVDLGLGMVEELFTNEGSDGFARVVASIRGSLSDPGGEAADDDEPPPPQRFEPPPTFAVRRRREKPTIEEPLYDEMVEHRPARSRFVPVVLVVVAVAAGAFVMIERGENRPTPVEPSTTPKAAPTVAIRVRETVHPTPIPESTGFDEELDLREEEMAQFTFEISLTERCIADGDLNEAMKHFAAAAAIDRHHSRVTKTGRMLIASLLQEADRAYDEADWDLASRRVQSARSLARGLRLDDSNVDQAARKLEVMTRFQDVSPQDRGALTRAVGHPVRLTLKSANVIFGQLEGVEGEFLFVEAYSGVKGGEVEFSTKLLLSTVLEVRVYDADRLEEIITGD